MAYCSVCGTPEIEDQKFCAACGAARSGSGSGAVSGSATGFSMPPMSPLELTPAQSVAGFWWRFVGYLIDTIILGVVIIIPLRVANASFYTGSIIQVVAAFFYFGLFVRYFGQTPGMRLFRMRCFDVNGAPVTSSQAFVRAGVYCVFLLVASLYPVHRYVDPTVAEKATEAHQIGIYLLFAIPHYLDLLWAGWDKRRQTLHDKAAGTVVVRYTGP